MSIFIDESGDIGEYSPISPYYIIAMVFHNHEEDIFNALTALETELSECGFPHHCLHAGPIIRREEEYQYSVLAIRQKL